MEGILGVVNKKEEVVKKSPVFLTGLLAIILIITFIFALKTYEPAQNILISGGVTVYPLTFLIVALISKYYGFKESRKSIYIASALYVVFMLLMMLSVAPLANKITAGHNTVIQYLFTNEHLMIGDFRIFYPTLGQFFSTVVAFLVSHLVYAAVYNAVGKFTVEYLAVGLGIFISYIIDRILYMSILYAKGLMEGANTFDFFIKCLTSEFMATIVLAIAIICIYMIIINVRKSVKKA